MTSTVTSKFSKSLWVAPVLLGVLISMLIAVCPSLSQPDYNPNDEPEIVCILVIITLLICYNTYHAIRRFIKVTVTPDVLLLHYLLINNQKIINYADIAHVSLVQENTQIRGTADSRSSPGDNIKLKIELNSGQKLYLFEEYYQNFDELKEAIRRARFKLD